MIVMAREKAVQKALQQIRDTVIWENGLTSNYTDTLDVVSSNKVATKALQKVWDVAAKYAKKGLKNAR